MSYVDQRAALQRLIEERREDYAGLSRLIGRNPAYIQQFIKRGSPRRLDAEDVSTLSRYFGVPEAVLGGRATAVETERSVAIRRLNVHASAGHGALDGSEARLDNFIFDRGWLKQLTNAKTDDLSLIRVAGDSMAPTLADGDDILVDRSDAESKLRDGIYVLRLDDSLVVKRIARSPAARLATIKSDNPAYAQWHDVDLSALTIIGRVIWAARKLA